MNSMLNQEKQNERSHIKNIYKYFSRIYLFRENTVCIDICLPVFPSCEWKWAIISLIWNNALKSFRYLVSNIIIWISTRNRSWKLLCIWTCSFMFRISFLRLVFTFGLHKSHLMHHHYQWKDGFICGDLKFDTLKYTDSKRGWNTLMK